MQLINKVGFGLLRCRSVEEAWRFQEWSACELLLGRSRMCGSKAAIDEDCGRVDDGHSIRRTEGTLVSFSGRNELATVLFRRWVARVVDLREDGCCLE